MSNITFILLASGVAAFIIFILVILVKKENKITFPTVSILLISLILVTGSLVNTLLEINVFESNTASTKEEPTNVVEKNEPKSEQPKQSQEVESEEEQVVQEPSPPVSNESEFQRMARELVEIEMAKQVGLKEWEITENEVTSDQEVYNISDYDKPEGDMRIVWVSGNVQATTEEDNITGNVGFELELYQMKGEDTWYIGNHWGALISLELTEYQ
ncbi:hypothetical protein [Ornithinibacillus californiensis]|jgi:hypothetical protein|uniref:hypothetical protein n=1 Tax=Ornithinibacillus californiensis TaxID=161536 RepID=UPI00064DACB4|nr:hypothetical protein [Ornithinibacillus californiensis]